MSTIKSTFEYMKSVASIKSLLRNPNIYTRQLTRRFRSFPELVKQLSSERPLLSVVQIGANDGVSGDPLGGWILMETEKIKALLIEPQSAAYRRLAERYATSPHVICLQAAIDNELGQRIMYSINPEVVAKKTKVVIDDRIGSFDRDVVFRFVRRRLNKSNCLLTDDEIQSLITEEAVEALPLKEAMKKTGVLQPDVILADVEGFDAEIVRMVLDDGLRPHLIQYEHAKLSNTDRRSVSNRLIHEGYRLWANRSDAWGQKLSS